MICVSPSSTDRSIDGGKYSVSVPPFRGAYELVDLIKDCYTRPSAGHRRSDLPIVWLVRDPIEYGDLLQALDRKLGGGSSETRRVPHAYHRLPAGSGGTDIGDTDTADGQSAAAKTDSTVLDILRTLADEFSRGRNSRAGWYRFPRLQLVAWLMKQDLAVDSAGDPEEDPPDRVLRRRLRLRAWNRRAPTVAKDIGQNLTGGWATAAAVLFRVPALLRWLRSSGRVPGLGGEYRWLFRQRYLTPRDPGTFVGFAERLTVGSR